MLVTLGLVSRLRSLLAEGGLNVVFQPIIDLASRTVLGHEALLRGPLHSPLERPEDLFMVARYASLAPQLEEAACVQAIRNFAARRCGGHLFLNLSAPMLVKYGREGGGALYVAASQAGLSASSIVLELTEHERVEDVDELERSVGVLQALGMQLAIDDFGDGRSSLRLWTQLKPAMVKLDGYFARDIDRDSRKAETLRALLQLSQALGTPLIAEAVERAAELSVLRDLGCRFAQGHFLGLPQPLPVESMRGEARQVLDSSKIAVLPVSPMVADSAQTVERLMVDAPTVAVGTASEDVARLFNGHPELHALAVLDAASTPVGLINRRGFLDRYAQPFHRELYGRRSCMLFMNPDPLRVEKGVAIDALISVLTGDDQRYLYDGFVITDGGRYAGLATGESLVRAVTERRVEAARHANPLTLLPGNIPITQHIRRLLENRIGFAAAYFDLNNFKPYNDLYGYWRGDEMIKLLAAEITEHCDRTHDFVGHVGGDDFVVLFQSEDWRQRCEAIVQHFNASARTLFDEEELERGGMEGEDRRGFRTFFPLTTVAVGMVWVRHGVFRDPETVASAAATAKKVAKTKESGVYLLEDGLHLVREQRA